MPSQQTAVHIPVLVRECVELLGVRPGGQYIDCTLGAAGHAAAILERSLPGGRLLGIDLDPKAIRMATERLHFQSKNVTLVKGNFLHLADIAASCGFEKVDGILFDLGVCSLQLDDPGRGFSFRYDASLDMRFDPAQATTAVSLVNELSESELAEIFEKYGEERRSRMLARRIVAKRPVNTTFQLADVIQQAAGRRGKIHPATRIFQALRIAVNRELVNLEQALEQTTALLSPGGRLAVISYHSLEDRLVKRFLQRESKGCLCPPHVPICQCGHTATLGAVNRKAITPSIVEKQANPRSRSAKLRVAERL
jgi:16S rRNA (cytosine1402-N4)-methyltransferase